MARVWWQSPDVRLARRLLVNSVCLAVLLAVWFEFVADRPTESPWRGRGTPFSAVNVFALLLMLNRAHVMVSAVLEWRFRNDAARTESIARNRKVHVYVLELLGSCVLAPPLVYFFWRAFVNESDSSCRPGHFRFALRLETAYAFSSPELQHFQSNNDRVPDDVALVLRGSDFQLLSEGDAGAAAQLFSSCFLANLWPLGTAVTAAIALYAYELAFAAWELRGELQAHHVLVVALFLASQLVHTSTVISQVAALNIAAAMLEQPVFAALLAYRVVDGRHLLKARCFLVAAVWFVISKVLVFAWSASLLLGDNLESGMVDPDAAALFGVLLAVVVCTQLVSSIAMAQIYRKCMREHARAPVAAARKRTLREDSSERATEVEAEKPSLFAIV